MMYFRHRSLGYSITLHVIIAALAIYSSAHRKKSDRLPEITIRLRENRSDRSSWIAKRTHPSKTHSSVSPEKSLKQHPPIDLRPNFAKNQGGLPFGPSSKNSTDPSGTEINREAQDLLHADGRSVQAFDQLALLINGHLDYPDMLAENGVQGLATLDLYFDHDAKIDEARSRMTGDNRWVRGLLIRAARIGLTDWFRGIGGNLDKAQFRDQHFCADFVITYTDTHSSDLEKNGEGSYHLVRRRLVQTCLNPAMGGLDLACAAARVAGAISSQVSQSYKIKYQALKDRLEQLDETGLNGINQEVFRRT